MNNYTDVDEFTGEGFERFEHAEGEVEYRYKGRYHREEGPAITLADGSELWYLYGKLQAIAGPIANLTQATKPTKEVEATLEATLEATQLSDYKDVKKKTGIGYERVSKGKAYSLYLNGGKHCSFAPAVVGADGRGTWWLNDKRHCTTAPSITYPDGREVWHFNGKIHREDGPAVTRLDGYESWWRHGERHRIGGPAVTRTDGTLEYWENNVQK